MLNCDSITLFLAASPAVEREMLVSSVDAPTPIQAFSLSYLLLTKKPSSKHSGEVANRPLGEWGFHFRLEMP